MLQKCFFIAKKTEENYFKFSFRLIKCNKIIETMEHKKILNLLNEASNSKFVTRK